MKKKLSLVIIIFLGFKMFLQNKMILGIFAPKIYIYLQLVLYGSADWIGNYRIYWYFNLIGLVNLESDKSLTDLLS